MNNNQYPITKDKIIRCRVTNVSTYEVPKENNATIFGVEGGCALVLLDDETKIKYMNLGWVTFDKGAAKP
jgi:hypothetical protein